MLPVLPDSVESSRRIGAGSVTAVSERPQCKRGPSGPLRSSKSGK
jgi:hypothetical protein